MNSFVDVLSVIDRVMGVKGRKIEDREFRNALYKTKNSSNKRKTRQIWAWEAEKIVEGKEKRFEMNLLKKHVKFD